MDRANSILKGIALATIPVVGVFLCLFLLQMSDAVRVQSNGVSAVLAQADAALTTINKPKSGTLSMLDDTILQGRLTIDATNKVLLHEQTQLSTLDGDIEQLSTRTNATLSALTTAVNTTSSNIQTISDHVTPVLDTTKTTIASIQPPLNNASLLFFHADTFVKTLPAISDQTKDILANGETISHDAVVEEQKYVYPKKVPWYKNILPIVLKSGELAYDFIR